MLYKSTYKINKFDPKGLTQFSTVYIHLYLSFSQNLNIFGQQMSPTHLRNELHPGNFGCQSSHHTEREQTMRFSMRRKTKGHACSPHEAVTVWT